MSLKHLQVFTLYLILIGSAILIQANVENIQDISEEYQIVTDVGRNITLPCWPKDFPNKSASVYWLREGKRGIGERVLEDGSLFIGNLSKEDTNLYTCKILEEDHILTKIHLYVRGPPDSPVNVSVKASTVVAVVTWHQHLDNTWEQEMGGAITSLHLKYRIVNSSIWSNLPHHLPPSQGQVDVYHLQPNSTYEFLLWSQNRFGKSCPVSIIATTHPEMSEIELSYHMLQSSEGFSPRVWLMAVVLILLVVNVFGTVLLLVYSKMNKPILVQGNEYSEQIELVPNIIENPCYYTDYLNSSDNVDEREFVQSTTTSLSNPSHLI